MKKIVMSKTVSGAPDGLHVFVYEEGKIYPNAAVPLSEELYDVFVNQIKAAVDYVKPEAVVKHELKLEAKQQPKPEFKRKNQGPSPENKAIKSAPEDKSGKLTAADFEGLGAGKVRQLASKHGVDLKDKPFNTMAKNLVTAFLERQ
jgi:hypothetical protein